jgi:hypothetical protein
MARRIVTDFDAEILQRMGNRTDITPTQRGFFLRDAYLAVSKSFDHAQLQGDATDTVLNGSDLLSVTAITDLWWPVQIRDTLADRIILPADKDEIDNMQKYSGPPTRYYWWNEKFIFDTKADRDRPVSVKYKKKPVMFTTSPVLDEIYDQLLILKGAQIGFETARDLEQAAGVMGLYRGYISEYGLVPTAEEKKNDYRTGFRVRYR